MSKKYRSERNQNQKRQRPLVPRKGSHKTYGPPHPNEKKLLPGAHLVEPSHFGTLAIIYGDVAEKKIALLYSSHSQHFQLPTIRAFSFVESDMKRRLTEEVGSMLDITLGEIQFLDQQPLKEGVKGLFLCESFEGEFKEGKRVQMRQFVFEVVIRPIEAVAMMKIFKPHKPIIRSALEHLCADRDFYDRYKHLLNCLSKPV